MKEFATLSALIPVLAQIPSEQATWERLGVAGLSLAATAFIWRYFVNKEASAQAKRDELDKSEKDKRDANEAEEKAERKEREERDIAERNRLLAENNRLTTIVIDLNREQIVKSDKVAEALVRSQVEFLKANEDSMRSLKDLTRKVHCARLINVDASAAPNQTPNIGL